MKKRWFVLLLSFILILNTALPNVMSVSADTSQGSDILSDVSGADVSSSDVFGADILYTDVSHSDVVDLNASDADVPALGTLESKETDSEVSVSTACSICGADSGHAEGCIYDLPLLTYGNNPPYRGVGPLMESEAFAFPQVALFTLDDGLARTAEHNGSKVTISEGPVEGVKEVTNTGRVNATTQEPIYKIDLTANAVSDITGESCDFVLVLDMSYSMSGENLKKLKEACITFVEDLYNMAKYSRVAIVTYGGDKNANKYYITKAGTQKRDIDTTYYRTTLKSGKVLVDDGGSVTLQEYTGANIEKQQWRLEYVPGGENVTLCNIATGKYLTVNDTQIQTSSSLQRWVLNSVLNEQAGKDIESFYSGIGANRVSELSISGSAGKLMSQDGVSVTMGTAASTSDDDWILVPVHEEAEYETYYWTDSTNPNGYENRTDLAAADSAFLVVSEDDGTNGTKINQKLLNAINNLEVYGKSYQGSFSGDAFEKATRIYQSVRLTDNNDYCDETGEYYYNSKRGVLYFADGAPSPIDGMTTAYYPQNGCYVRETYGLEYNFLDTYRDIQDALNWSKVLKYTKGGVIVDGAPGYDASGNWSDSVNPFSMGYVTNYSQHEYKEYRDVTFDASNDAGVVGDTVTGCGATVYVLTINLPTMDVTLDACKVADRHPGKECVSKDMINEAGEKVVICDTFVNPITEGTQYFFRCFASYCNQYFYRLSSHRYDATHISAGDPNDRTAAQKLWHDTYTWGGKYPDFLCRNQKGGYFVACDNQDAIQEAFKGVALQTAKTLSNLTMTDNITQSFVIADRDGNPVQVGTRILADGTIIDDSRPDPNTLFGTVALNDQQNQCIVWKGFELNPGDGQGTGVKNFDVEFYLVPKDGFLGGNNVPTNDGAELAGPDDKPIIKYPDPDVNVDVSVDKVGDITLEARAGAVFLNEISYDQLLKLITIKVSETGSTEPTMTLKPSEDNYGLETWQNDYVNIKIALYDTQVDADGNQLYDDNGMPIPSAEITAGGKLSEIRRKREVIVQVWVWPKTYENGELEPTEPPKDAQTASGVCKIEVYYPTFVFSDVTLYHGQPLKLATEVWGKKMDATPYLYWYTNEEYETLLKNPEAKPRSKEYPNGYEPLPEGSFGKGEDVVADDEVPEVYFKVDPIDATITELDHKTGPVDEDFYSKFGDYMGKEQIAMNVRVFFTNEDDTGAYDPDDPTGTAEAMRNAFFLHTAIKTVSAVPKHTSGSSNSEDVYWGPEFFINPAYCELTINKTGGLPDETYVFTIARGLTTEKLKDGTVIQEETEPTYYTTVSITTDGEGKGSVKLTELPVGVYTVTEDLEWSWRYKESTPTLSWEYEDGTDGSGTKIYLRGNAAEDAAVVNVANSNPTKRWFNGVSDVVKNIFGKKGQ